MPEETTTTTETPATAPVEPATDQTAEVEKWKAMARKNEARAKENAAAAKELEEYKAKNQTETEKAIEAARLEGRNLALKEVGARLVDATVKTACAGRDIDVDTLLDGLDRSRFLDDDGNPDESAIQAWVDKLAPAPDPDKQVFPDLGQGQRGSAPSKDPLTDALLGKLGISH